MFGLFGSNLVHLIHFSRVWSIWVNFGPFGLLLYSSVYSVYFAPFSRLWSSSIHSVLFGLYGSTLVQFSLLVDFGPIRPIQSTLVCFSQVQSIESISVHQSISVYFSPVQSIYFFYFFGLHCLINEYQCSVLTSCFPSLL